MIFNNFRQTPRVPAFFCTPETVVAKRFRDLYGEVFTVQNCEEIPGELHLTVATGHGKNIYIKKTSEGIFVDDKFFAKSWKDEEEDEDGNT